VPQILYLTITELHHSWLTIGAILFPIVCCLLLEFVFIERHTLWLKLIEKTGKKSCRISAVGKKFDNICCCSGKFNHLWRFIALKTLLSKDCAAAAEGYSNRTQKSEELLILYSVTLPSQMPAPIKPPPPPP
jgi:hypothetical protein